MKLIIRNCELRLYGICYGYNNIDEVLYQYIA